MPGILNIFRKKIINTTSDFTIDLDNQGRHAVEVYIAIDEEKQKIQNIQEIWNYGSIFKRNNKQFTISLESLEILNAMRSLNPIITDDGRMIFDVFPPVLKYLRSKKIKETEKSKTELKISDTPLKQGVNIDYDPNKGLIVETGYRHEGTQKLIAPEDIKIIADGSYARIGNTFYSTSEENIKPEVKRWLDTKPEVIPLDRIPQFFKRDLVLLKTKLGAVLTEKANAIEIINEPLKPKISVRKDEPGWLDFKIDYISDKYELSYEMIKKQKNEYVHLDDYKWVHIDNDIIKNTEMNLRELGANRTPTGFRIPINQFFSLEEFVEQIGGIKEVTAEYQRFLEEITDFKTDEYFKLPEEIELDEWVELTNEQKLLYRQIQDGAYQITDALQKGETFNYKFSILPILTKLKQVCDHPAIINQKIEPIEGRSEKFDLVIDKVHEIHNSGEQVVLFTHFLKTLDLLEIAFRLRGVKYIRLDGSTQDRQMYIDRFNQKKVDAALCSIQACGHGINLTAANHVIHVDRWWNPAVEDQATDRVHRIGQDKTVYVYRILTKGTLEEKIALRCLAIIT